MFKKLLLLSTVMFCAVFSGAEALRLKNGTILTGQIVDRGQYTLNFKTQYGVITVAQKDIVEELPDMQRITLKGGGEIIGVIEDMTQFNVRVKTDTGYVNVDMPKIDSIEVYDYESAEKQKKYVEQTIAETQKKETASAQETAATGLSFDEDLDKAFAAKAVPAAGEVEYTVVRGVAPAAQSAPLTPAPSAVPAAQDVYRAPVDKKDLRAAAKTSETKPAKDKKAAPKSAALQPSSAFRYVAVEAGAISNKFKVNNSKNDAGGVGMGAGIKYLWRVFKTNLWAGPGFTLAAIPNGKFNPTQTIATQTDGQLFQFNLIANYYLTRDAAAWQPYVTAAAGYESASINLRTTDSTTDPTQPVYSSGKASSSGFVASAGIGIERKFGDTSLGVEGRYYSVSRSGDLKGSPSGYYSAMLKASWKF